MAGACTQGVDTGFVALGYGKVAALGVVQGITELMPISSTAHMRVVPALLGWQDPGSAFSAIMQLAALFAVVSFFWSDVRNLIVGATTATYRRDWGNRDFRHAMYIVLGTVPIVIFGLLLKDMLNACNSPLRSLTVIGISCIVMATLLAISEVVAKHYRTYEQVTLKDALIVGLSQVGALIPGVSRSGSTITAALFLGFKREEAARFSFLLGLPAIMAAGLKEVWVLYKAGLDAHGWSVLGVGLLVGSLSAFVAIWSLMRVLERFSSWPFVMYRAAMGGLLLTGVYLGFLQ
jgi:undecaprenyl-diphosphatase